MPDQNNEKNLSCRSPDCFLNFGPQKNKPLRSQIYCSFTRKECDKVILKGGFIGDTKISLADNRDLTILELIDEYNSGNEVFCFSLDRNGNIVIDKIEMVKQIKAISELMKITLDNSETIYCDLNCNFISRDNSIVEASNLKNNQSLMPLYLDLAKNVPYGKEDYKRHKNLMDYSVVFNPSTELYKFVHSLADKYNIRNLIYNKRKGNTRHHKDYNKYNNNPTNIDRLSISEHFELHSKLGSENMKKLHQDPEFQERHRKRASKNISEYLKSEEFYEMTRKAGKRGKEYLIKYNKSEKGRKKSSEIGREGKMKCQECGKEVFGRAEMTEHYKKNHPDVWAQNQMVFQKAALEYVRSEEYRKAQSEKLKSGKIKCRECGEVVYGASELRKHYAEEHNYPVQCPYCGISCKGKGGLSTHIRFCPENPDREIRVIGYFECPYCDRVFGSQRGLSGHINRGHNVINHKIINIEIIKREPTMIYTLKLKEFRSFGLSAGIFVQE